jgi:hypothetical protein
VNLADATLENIFDQAEGNPDAFMRLFDLLGELDVTVYGVDGLEVPIMDATIADLEAHKGYSLQRRLLPPGAHN